MNRLGIFVFYDANGIVDDFIPYLLDDLKKNLSRLVIICNGFVNDEGREILSNYSTEIIERENADYDGGAYRYILREYLSRKEVEKYDELLLFNDTFCGPFYSFDKVFDEMSERNCDIWGLSMHGECIIFDKQRSEHIQSYFINIKEKALKSDSFWNYWASMEHATDFDEAVFNFEIAFSETMKAAGFKLGAYLYIDKYMSNDPKENFNYSQIRCGESAEEYGFPIFKRKNLMNQTPGNDEMRRAIDYIYNHYDYPLDYVWKPVYRKFELGMRDASFGLNHVFRKRWKKSYEDVKVICLLYSELEDYKTDLQEMIDQLPTNVNIVFCDEEPTLYLRKHEEIFEQYDYIGIMNDCNYSFDGNGAHRHVRRMRRDYLFRHTLFKKETISYLSEIAKYQKTIGLVYAVTSAESNWRTLWFNAFWKQSVENLLNEKGIKFRNSEPNMPVYGQDSFWCESGLLRSAMDYLSEDKLDAWYLALPYIAQHLGRGMVFYRNEESADSIIGEGKYFLNYSFRQLVDHMNRANSVSAENEELKGRLAQIEETYKQEIERLKAQLNKNE